MGGRDLNAYNFIIAIITGRSLNWSLTLIYVFKLVLKNGFNLLFCCLPSEEAVVMSAWWGVDRLGYLPERLNRSSFIGLCSHTFSVKFSAGWHWKAFAGSPGSLSAYLLSKLVAAPELKRSEKEEEEEKKKDEKTLVSGNLVLRAMGSALQQTLDLNSNHLLPNWLKYGLPT